MIKYHDNVTVIKSPLQCLVLRHHNDGSVDIWAIPLATNQDVDLNVLFENDPHVVLSRDQALAMAHLIKGYNE